MGGMLRFLRRTLSAGLNRSPRENLQRLHRKLRRRLVPGSVAKLNAVVPEVRKDRALGVLAATRLPESCRSVGLLGGASETWPYRIPFREAGMDAVEVQWDWGDSLKIEALPDAFVVCKVPTYAEHWQALKELRQSVPIKVLGVSELLLPFAPVQLAQSLLPYYEETATLGSIAPFYLGREYFRPIDKLDETFSLSGKSVIEFGPMDGCLTAGLVAAGVGRLVSMEARAENFIKTLIARETFGWDNVELVMDDFHNADESTYGRFDLVFAHGVYYHSIAPFHFFSNTLSLSDHIYLGGFCATDSLPEGPYEMLRYHTREYRAKRYEERSELMTAGVNAAGYFFQKDDLMKFFRDEGCDVEVLSDEPSDVTAGRYLRFLARRSRD